MGITFNDGDGFPGGRLTLQSSTAAIFDTSIPHWNTDLGSWMGQLTYRADGMAGVGSELKNMLPDSPTDWVTMGCYVYLDGASGSIGGVGMRISGGTYFTCAFDGNAQTLSISNANGNLLATITGIDNTETAQRFVVKFQPDNAGALYLWYNPWNEPAKLVFFTASGDWRPGTQTVMHWGITGATFGNKSCRFSDPFQMFDDGANWDTHDTTFGTHRWNMGNWTWRHYNTAQVGTSKDFGNQDPVGAFVRLEEKPLSNNAVGHDSQITWTPGDPVLFGGVFHDHASEGGPADDLFNVHTVLAAKFSMEHKRGTSGKTIGQSGQWFGTDSVQIATGRLTTGTSFAVNTEYASIAGFGNVNPTAVPDVTEYLAAGFGVHPALSSPATTTITCGEHYAQILVAEPRPRYVNQNGRIRQIRNDFPT